MSDILPPHTIPENPASKRVAPGDDAQVALKWAGKALDKGRDWTGEYGE